MDRLRSSGGRRCYCCSYKLLQNTKPLSFTPSDGQTRSTSSISRRSTSIINTHCPRHDTVNYTHSSSQPLYSKIRYNKVWRNSIPEYRYNPPTNYRHDFPTENVTSYTMMTSQTTPAEMSHKVVPAGVVNKPHLSMEKQFYAPPHISDNHNENEEKCRNWIETLPDRFSGLNTVISLPALSPEYRQ